MTGAARTDLLFSGDIEADGPIPGPYSMVSFGLCVVGTYAPGGTFTRRDLRKDTFYRELRPISERFLPHVLAISKLDRDRLLADGADPATAMQEAGDWVRDLAGAEGMNPVLVGWPAGFDWMFLHWYWTEFTTTGDPFGHAAVLDIKTLAWVRMRRPLDGFGKPSLPEALKPKARHTHHALDDAIEQGELFANLLEWQPPT